MAAWFSSGSEPRQETQIRTLPAAAIVRTRVGGALLGLGTLWHGASMTHAEAYGGESQCKTAIESF